MMFAVNRNLTLTDLELESLMRKYFINYNCNLKFNEVSKKQYETPITFKPFDYLVVRYIWTSEGGADLDTRTCFIETGTVLDNDKVGYGQGPNIVIDSSHKYLEWGGDNTGAGVESVLIDFKKVSEDYSNTSFNVRLNALWYSVRRNGQVSVQMETYLGGTMSKSGYNFINTGGVVIDSASILKTVITNTNDSSNEGDILAYIKYMVGSKTAKLSEL